MNSSSPRISYIGAIETAYNGLRFRSRLEARWALFFDAMGIEYQYEAQGYEVNGHRYLPDFWLPQFKAHAEVKGDPEGLINDWERMQAVLDHESPLPHFRNSAQEKWMCVECDYCPGLLLLGDIPRLDWGIALHPVIRHSEGLVRDYFEFWTTNGEPHLSLCDGTDLYWVKRITGEKRVPQAGIDYIGCLVDSICVPTRLACAATVSAYERARQERF